MDIKILTAAQFPVIRLETYYLTAMIERSAMVDVLKTVFPDFASTCDAFVAEWSEELDLPYYLLLGDFSRFLVTLLESNDRKQLQAAFELIESLHRDGDEYED